MRIFPFARPKRMAGVAHFLDNVENGTQPSGGGPDGLRALELAETAKASLESGQPMML